MDTRRNGQPTSRACLKAKSNNIFCNMQVKSGKNVKCNANVYCTVITEKCNVKSMLCRQEEQKIM